MAKNLTSLHKKLDRLFEQMAASDEMPNPVRRLAALKRYWTRAKPLLHAMALEMRQSQKEQSRLNRKALKAARESAERTAEIMREISEQGARRMQKSMPHCAMREPQKRKPGRRRCR